MDAGMEAVYTGLRQSPQAIASAALEEDVDVLGLSVLSGAHVPLCRKVARELEARQVDDITWIVGGNIPPRDHPALKELGVDAIFPTGTEFVSIVAFIQDKVRHE